VKRETFYGESVELATALGRPVKRETFYGESVGLGVVLVELNCSVEYMQFVLID
jgi:hypothetical protein